MIISEQTIVTQLMQAFTKSGATPPPAVATAYASTTKLVEAGRKLGGHGEDLTVAVVASLDAGRDPATDPAVAAIVTARAINNPGMTTAIAGIAYDRFRRACRDNADGVVASLRAPFDKAAGQLVKAHNSIGDADLADGNSVHRTGPGGAEAWASAKAGVDTIAAIAAAWVNLADLTRLVSIDRRYRLLSYADISPDQWLADGWASQPKADAWALVCAGVRLHLPTFAEYKTKVAAVQAKAAEPDLVVDRGRSHVAGRVIKVPA